MTLRRADHLRTTPLNAPDILNLVNRTQHVRSRRTRDRESPYMHESLRRFCLLNSYSRFQTETLCNDDCFFPLSPEISGGRNLVGTIIEVTRRCTLNFRAPNCRCQVRVSRVKLQRAPLHIRLIGRPNVRASVGVCRFAGAYKVATREQISLRA